MEKVNIIIDGNNFSVPKTSTVLEAAQIANIKIPTLCYHPELRPAGACRVCMVEVQGARSLVASCVYPVNEGMVIKTNTTRVREGRKAVVELLLANHPKDCLSCQRSGNCELQTIAADLNIRKIRFHGQVKELPLDNTNPCLVRDQEKCILCGRCVKVCSDRQGIDVYSFMGRGFDTTVTTAFSEPLEKTDCTYCGQCTTVCPTAAIVEKDDTEKVWAALNDPTKHVVVQTAPSVRVALGEELGIPVGNIVTGKMVSAIRRLGFDKVFDTNFSADLTIMEEGAEFIHRLQNKGLLPMITSCSPAWVKFAENFYPELLDHLSSAKSPQQMFGAVVKTYYAQVANIDPKDIVSVSVMPCTAKKYEAARPEMNSSGYQDVDVVITTRELGRMIRESGLDFSNLPEEEFDSPMGLSTGAGMIFGTTGGVMEAALRTVVEKVSGKPLEQIEFMAVRGMDEVREATLNVAGIDVKIAVVHTLQQARKMLDLVAQGKADYHFIEIMSCPGGCIGGGGQPVPINLEKRLARRAAMFESDDAYKIRKSHENPAIIELYEKFLGEPMGEKAHHLLHTHYNK